MTRIMDVSLITLGDPRKTTGGYLYHLRLAEAAPAYDARISFASFRERAFPLPLLDGAAVFKRAQEPRPDVVVLDSIAAAFLAPSLLREPLRAPLVAVLHQPPGGIDHGPLRTAMQAPLDRLAYRRARALIVASDSLRDRMVDEDFDPERIVVVPPGRDVAEAPSADPQDLRRGGQVAVLCVGNWLERKGILQLLEAFSALPRGLAVLHLVGDDEADPRYARRVRARLNRPDLRDRVVAHGPVSRQRIAAFYRDADVFILASTKEPYGTSYGEAMAYGLPVVGWRAGNLPYLAGHRHEALIVEPGDTQGLGRALEEIARDEELRLRLGEAARQKAERTFITWEETARLFFSVLRDLSGARL
jgi:glycosyltransferase involved in cell wall biosynthesis